jgi:hypothetical protein
VLFGLPIDIRHVAFSSAFVGIAVVGTDFAPNLWLLLWAVLGVAAIGFINLTVSFALALNIALRSRQVSDTPWRMIAGAVLRHLWQHPREFFLPPKKTGSGVGSAVGSGAEWKEVCRNSTPPTGGPLAHAHSPSGAPCYNAGLSRPQDLTMKRNRLSSRKRISADATELGRLATGLAESGGKLEEVFWEKQLVELVEKLLQDGAEDDLNASLDRLFDSHAAAHDCLADTIEALRRILRDDASGAGLRHPAVQRAAARLVALFDPERDDPEEHAADAQGRTSAHTSSPANAQLALADYLYSPDQLPRSFVDTWQLMRDLGGAALCNSAEARPGDDAGNQPVPLRHPLPARRHRRAARHAALPLERADKTAPANRRSRNGSSRAALPRTAAHRLRLPDAARRRTTRPAALADMASRPYSLRASVAFLQTTLGKPAESLRAVIGGFHDKRLEEYRIGFGPRDERRDLPRRHLAAARQRGRDDRGRRRNRSAAARIGHQGSHRPRPAVPVRVLRRLRRAALPERRRRHGARRNAGAAERAVANAALNETMSNADLLQRSLAAVWHPCTQMKQHANTDAGRCR